MSTLKYEGLAKVGDRIKAYHFKPCPGRPERWLEGTVAEVKTLNGATFFKLVDSTNHTAEKVFTVDGEAYVPLEIFGDDFKGRVSVI